MAKQICGNSLRSDEERVTGKGSSIFLFPQDPETTQSLPPSPGERVTRRERQPERKKSKKERKRESRVQYVREGGRERKKEWECEQRKAKLQEEEGGRKKEMLLRVLDGNFSNEKTMTVLRVGLHQYESLPLTPECILLLLTQEEHQKDNIG